MGMAGAYARRNLALSVGPPMRSRDRLRRSTEASSMRRSRAQPYPVLLRKV